MERKIECIMLIDDNEDDNFFHKRVINKAGVANKVITFDQAIEALKYLEAVEADNYIVPSIIFLDINMPKMNGWAFLEEYEKLDKELQSDVVVMMLTTSLNPDDKSLADQKDTIGGFCNKPLTKEMLANIVEDYWNQKRKLE